MKPVSIAAMLLALAAPALAHAKPFSDHAGRCVADVPASWTPGEFGLGMQSPGGQSTAAISSTALGLPMTKQVAQSTFTVIATFEDTPARYFVAIEDRVGKPMKHYYVAVPGAGFTCTLSVDFDAALSDADARAIALSLKHH